MISSVARFETMRFTLLLCFVLFAMTNLVGAQGGNRRRLKVCLRSTVTFGIRFLSNGTGIPLALPKPNIDNIPYIPTLISNISNCFCGEMRDGLSDKIIGNGMCDCLQGVITADVTFDSFRFIPDTKTALYANNRAGSTLMNFLDPLGEIHQLHIRSYNDIVPISIGSDEIGASARITHHANSYPDDGADQILRSSTGIFLKGDITGTSRLAGGVNLDLFISHNQVFFDCFFQLRLTRLDGRGWPCWFMKVMNLECRDCPPICRGGQDHQSR